MKAQEKLIELVSKKGIRTVYNPSSYITRHGPDYLRKILRRANILILNEEEARDLVRAGGDLFRGLHRLGPEIVCITYGKKGNAVSDGRKVYVAHPNEVKVAEVTGAGDVFGGGFVFGMMEFKDVKKAIQCGTLNAESVIQIPGAKNGLLTYKQIMNKLNNPNCVRISCND